MRGVGDEEHRIGGGQRRDRRGVVHRREAADAGRVDELEPGRQQRHRQPELDELQTEVVVVVARLGAVLRPIFVGDRRDDRLGPDVVRGCGRLRFRGRSPADQRRDGGREVVVDRADVRVEQRVDQRALAHLELAGDDHADRGISDRTSPTRPMRAARSVRPRR